MLYIEQELYVGVLKHLSRNMAQYLFQDTSLPLGARIEFYYQWSQWINTINQCNQTSSLETNQHESKETIVGTSKNQSVIEINSTTTKVDLRMILNSNSYGRSLLKAVKETDQLNENLRKMLCESILQFCIVHQHDLTTSDCASLAKQICSTFPGEEMVHCVIFITFFSRF